MTFEKKYVPQDAEKKIREFWDKEKIYGFDPKSKKPIFSVDTPPPTVSGKMHIGHAFSYTQTDFIVRYKRMNGFNVFYPFGTDDNGLASEKLIQKNTGKDLRKMSKKEASELALQFLDRERPAFVQDFKDIGLSCDFDLFYSSISEHSQKISQKSFLDLIKKGHIERREGPVPWDRVFQTPIAQAELEDKKMKSHLNYIKTKFENSHDTYLIYATTRPELLYGCVGMSVEDEGDYVKLKAGKEYWVTGANTYEEKFKDFEYEIVERLKGKDMIGEKVIIPISNLIVDIDHDISVKADYGTGAVYYCTYGGLDCVEWMARHPEKKPISLLNKDGKLNERNGKYEGMLTGDARKEIIKDLEEQGHLIKKEEIEHVVNVGERSGAEVEYIVTKQWYVNYLDKKEYFFEMAQKFNWYPEFMKHRLENWIKGLNWDWGFSRQRNFGIPVPVWYDKDGNTYYADESQLPVDPSIHRPKGVSQDLELIPETDVFDTWFTSASSPFLAINLVEDEQLRKKLFPMDLRPQAHDIISFWLFYTMAKTNLLTDENPFRDVAISGWVLAPDGSKMSKSKGNTIVPQEIVAKYSNDAIRFAAASSKLGSDLPFMEKEVQTGIRVANKLYNANKFASMLLEGFKPEKIDPKRLDSIDRWILSRLAEVSHLAREAFEKYDYQKAKALYVDFFMDSVADNYIEIVKQRLWQKKENFESAQQVLYHVLYSSLRGIAPFMPYIAEEIYQILYSQYEKEKSIHLTTYPNEMSESESDKRNGDAFVAVVSAVRRYKAQNNLSMKEELEILKIGCPDDVKDFIEGSLDDLRSVTGAKKVEFGEGDMETEAKGITIGL